MDNEIGALGGEQVAHALAIANIQIEVAVAWNRLDQAADHGPRGPGGAEELLAHVVVDTGHAPTFLRERTRAIRPDQPARSGDKYFLVR